MVEGGQGGETGRAARADVDCEEVRTRRGTGGLRQRYVPSPKASLRAVKVSFKWQGSASDVLRFATPSTGCGESTRGVSRAWRSTYMTCGPILLVMVTVAKTATSLATGAPLPRTELVWTRRFRQEQRSPFWNQGRDLGGNRQSGSSEGLPTPRTIVGTGTEFAMAGCQGRRPQANRARISNWC